MADVFRTMIIPADYVELARAIADMFAGSPQNMWKTGLSENGEAPATHYAEAGHVPSGYQTLAPSQTWVWKSYDLVETWVEPWTETIPEQNHTDFLGNHVTTPEQIIEHSGYYLSHLPEPFGEWQMIDSYLGQAEVVFQACRRPISDEDSSPRIPCTLEQIQGLFASADLSTQSPFVAFQRLNLKLIQSKG